MAACKVKVWCVDHTALPLVQIFESLEALSHAAVACVYAIPSGTSWTLAAEMLATVRHALEEQHSGAESQALSGSSGSGAVRPKDSKAMEDLDQVRISYCMLKWRASSSSTIKQHDSVHLERSRHYSSVEQPSFWQTH